MLLKQLQSQVHTKRKTKKNGKLAVNEKQPFMKKINVKFYNVNCVYKYLYYIRMHTIFLLVFFSCWFLLRWCYHLAIKTKTWMTQISHECWILYGNANVWPHTLHVKSLTKHTIHTNTPHTLLIFRICATCWSSSIFQFTRSLIFLLLFLLHAVCSCIFHFLVLNFRFLFNLQYHIVFVTPALLFHSTL